MKKLPWRLVCWLACMVPLAAQADEVTVAVAANFAGPMAQLSQAFSARTGHTLKLTSGATGKFYSQIVAGAPFDVLLAADDETPRRLVSEGHAVAGTQFTYAVGQLVLWSAQPGLVDEQGSVLKTARYKHLAIANPKLAPYGKAALETLEAQGVREAVTGRIVTAESIAQAYQFVVSGNAEIGFVAWSQVKVPGKPLLGSYWLVPPSLHGEIRQDAVLLNRAKDSAVAQALLAYLRSAEAKALIQGYGYR